MATWNPRRFVELAALKRLSESRLIEFLNRFGDYFLTQGLEVPVPGEGIADSRYTQLSAILMRADSNAPNKLIDALYYVHQAATKETMERLLDQSKSLGLEMDVDENASAADVALAVWLVRPELLERVNAELRFQKRRNYLYYKGRGGVRPDHGSLQDLVASLTAWFVNRGRGHWCSVTPHVDEARTWYIVRHGDPMTREPSVSDWGSSSTFYRPERFDVLLHDSSSGEFWINADLKERELYQELFGQHLFGDPAFFPPARHLTLEPLREDMKRALNRIDVTGIKSIALIELTYFWPGSPSLTQVLRSEDLLSTMGRRSRAIPPSANIVGAKFVLVFEQSKAQRTVEICPPRKTGFTHGADGPLIEQWLHARGFIWGDDNRPSEGRFWKALETLPTLAAVRAEWQHILRGEWTLVQRYLEPGNDPAREYPCQATPECGCVHSVQEITGGEFVAVCQCDPQACEAISLESDDLIVRGVDARGFCTEIAHALGIKAKYELFPTEPHAHRIGYFSPREPHRSAVILFLCGSPNELETAMAKVSVELNAPFIALTPTEDMYSPGVAGLVERCRAVLASLPQIVSLADGGLVKGNAASHVFDKFTEKYVPPPIPTPGGVGFPTPAGTQWSEVDVRFKDGHRVWAQARDKRMLLTYETMGFIDRRDGSPDKQWELLESFATGHGVLDWSHQDADPKNQKRREELGKGLSAFFGIEEDPFEVFNDGHGTGWKAKFKIHPR